MNTVMELHSTNYRLERWIALFLALLFFLPFVAHAEERVNVAWHCTPSTVEGFKQCALMLDDQVLTYRMALDDQQLYVNVKFTGDVDGDSRVDVGVDISRDGRTWQPSLFLSTDYRRVHSARSRP